MFTGHTKRVRCLSVSQTGEVFATGSDDCSLRIWEIDTGRCLRAVTLPGVITQVAWCPNVSTPVVLAVVGEDVYFVATHMGGSHDEDPLPGSDVVTFFMEIATV